jgi:peroxiredoxin
MRSLTWTHRIRFGVVSVFAAAITIAGCSNAESDAKELKVLEIGAEVPGFTMVDHAGKEHSLADYAGKVVVLDFSSQQCPYSRAADPLLNDMVKAMEGKDLVLLSIDSHASTTVEEIAAYAEEHELTFPILKDEKNAYADELGATRTPEFFVVDKEGKLAYHGAFDDGREPGDGEAHYLNDAVTAVLAGEAPAKTTSKPIGCGINRAG